MGYNDGTINLGDGNDSITAINGFSGSGYVLLGAGNDVVSGFGTGYFVGGDGVDTLKLSSGSYTLGSTTVNNENFVTVTQGATTMNVFGFTNLIVGNQSYSFRDFQEINYPD